MSRASSALLIPSACVPEYQVPDIAIRCALQALEAATWAGLLKSPRAVLAGDHLQLPPTVISAEAMNKVNSICVPATFIHPIAFQFCPASPSPYILPLRYL